MSCRVGKTNLGDADAMTKKLWYSSQSLANVLHELPVEHPGLIGVVHDGVLGSGLGPINLLLGLLLELLPDKSVHPPHCALLHCQSDFAIVETGSE